MSSYTSLHEIKKDFQLESDNLDLIREQLNLIRVNNHPDRNNGEFKSDHHKDQYHKANQAVEYIDNVKNNHSLVVVEKMTDLIRVVTSLIPGSSENRQNTLEQHLETKIGAAITTYRSRAFLPKISLTAMTALISFCFFFPTQIKNNPTLGRFLHPDTLLFLLCWLCCLLCAAGLWVIAYRDEQKTKSRLALLKIDAVQNKLFEAFVSTNGSRISKDALTEFVHSRGNDRRFDNSRRSFSDQAIDLFAGSIFRSEPVTLEIAQNVTELIIARAEKNDIIVKLKGKTLGDTYELKEH